jgi:REP element-mobilizing transposase RayT
MRQPWTQLYVHLVWSTWKRAPLITPELQRGIYGGIQLPASQLGADVIAIGGVADHVHVLARFPARVAISDLVRRMKGASSHLITHVIRHEGAFKWQGGYGAFTLTKRAVPDVRDYILNQERHHREGTLLQVLERTDT